MEIPKNIVKKLVKRGDFYMYIPERPNKKASKAVTKEASKSNLSASTLKIKPLN